jgi:hypothetical protein
MTVGSNYLWTLQSSLKDIARGCIFHSHFAARPDTTHTQKVKNAAIRPHPQECFGKWGVQSRNWHQEWPHHSTGNRSYLNRRHASHRLQRSCCHSRRHRWPRSSRPRSVATRKTSRLPMRRQQYVSSVAWKTYSTDKETQSRPAREARWPAARPQSCSSQSNPATNRSCKPSMTTDHW